MRIPIACAALALLTFGCSKSDSGTQPTTVTPPAAVATVTLAPASTALVPQQTLQLTATTSDAAGNVLAGRAVTWSSSATSVATVSTNGLVTAAAVGAATITAASEGKSANVAITVSDGALVGAAGGTVTAANGKVVITIPPGALSVATAITVDTASPRSSASLVAGSSYALGPDGTQFAMPVTVRIAYDPAKVPAGYTQRDLNLFSGSRDTTVQIAPVAVDSVAHTVTGKTTHFSIYTLQVQRFAKVSDDTPLGRFVPAPNPDGEIVMCLGTPQEIVLDVVDPDLKFGTLSVFSVQTPIATVGGNTSGNADGVDPTIINPVSLGSTVIHFVINAPPKKRYARLAVMVTDKNPPCSQPTMAATLFSGNTDNIVFYGPLGVTPVTIDGVSSFPALGIGGGTNGPYGNQTQSGSANVYIYWGGTQGPAPAKITPSPGISIQGIAFTDRTTAVFAQQVSTSSGVFDLFRVTASGNVVPIRITNMRGAATSPAAAPDGTLYFEFNTLQLNAFTHIYSVTPPTGGNPVPVTTPIQVTSGTNTYEIQPAISQNGNLLAFSRGDPGFSYAQIQMIDLSKPAASPVQVSPPTGFAFAPAVCGNSSVLFTYSPNLNGPYSAFRFQIATGVISPITGLTGGSVFQIAVAPTTGDGGFHLCPK